MTTLRLSLPSGLLLVAALAAPLAAQDPADSAAPVLAPAETPAAAEAASTETPAVAEAASSATPAAAVPTSAADAPVPSPVAPADSGTNAAAEPAAAPAPDTNAPPAPPPPDPRAGDAPGWWFQAALRSQPRDLPAFYGVRFADASRAVLIEMPARALKVGAPLDYRLWVCNDLPQPLDARVTHTVRRDGEPIAAPVPADVRVDGTAVAGATRVRLSTAGWAPGAYTITATLQDAAGRVLHRNAETVTLSSASAAD